jgi:thiamine biosynthesis lipoprotein
MAISIITPTGKAQKDMRNPQPKKPLKIFKFRFQAMGTVCELQCYVASKEKGIAVADLVEADVSRLEQRYSRYRPDSLLSEINRVAAAGGEIEVDDETAGLFAYAETCYSQSDGLFDITSGLLRKAWRFDSGQLPDQDLIDDLLQHVGWHKLHWQTPVLKCPEPGMEIDFGGVVKEYAADRAAVICQNADVRHGFVNLGGDIRVIGPHPDGSPWSVGIQHPRQKGALLTTLEMFQGGMASSGDYERCIQVGDQRYSHIINPKTGWPVRHLASVSVAGDFCLVAGSASTIAMLKEQDGPQWLRDLGLPHVWMDVDGQIGGME